MKRKSIFLILLLLCAIVMKAQDYVEITFNEGLTTSYKLRFTVIDKNECSVKLSKAASQSTPLEIPTIVTIKNSDYYVTVIDTMAFKDKSIFSSVSLPDSLKIIRGHAFYKCTGLTGNLIIPENVTYIGEHAFNNCTGLTGNLIIPNKVKTIGNNAFYVCNGFSGKLIIPNSVTSIGNYAFYRCTKFTELSFEEDSNLKTIGDYAFAGYYNGSSSDYKMELTGELIIPNSVTSIGSHAFNLCTKLTKLSFEENSNLKTIGDYAFTGYNTFSTISMEFAGELIIPNSVTSIGNYAFFYCRNLTKLSFEENSNLKTIGNNSFYYNGFTGELTIPNSLTSIGNYAFYNCPFNKIICYSATPASFSGSNSIFYYASSTKKPTIYVPAASLETYKSTWNKDTNRIDANGFPTFIKNGSIEDVNNWHICENGSRTYRLPNQNEEIAINAELTINENEILNVKSLGYCNNGDLTIKEGGQLICDNIKNAIKVEKNIEAHSTTGNTTWTTISSPFGTDMNPSEITNLTTGNYSLYRYDEPSSLWENYKNSANNGFTKIEAGRGYLYSNSDNITLVFNGTSIAKNISYNLTNEAEILTGFHLVGNPFTHNISLSNLVTTGNVLAEGYYSLSNEGAWGVKYGEETEIKPCQGILIKTTEEGTLYINSTPIRNKKSVSNILAISVSNKKYSDITYISFNQGIGLDKIAHENKNIPMIYIPCQDADYAIAIKDKKFDEIPINFEVGTMGEYTISVSQKECGFKRLYLYDKVTGQTINILKNDYTFFAKTSDEPDRFVLKTVNDEILDNFTYINNGNLIIENIKGNANINIFDILGRNVLQTSCSDDEYQISTDRFSAGVYIIRKSDENGVKTQKVLID